MNTIIPEDLSAVGRYTCLHEFHEARKAAYFKPTARSLRYVYLGLISIYLLGKATIGMSPYWFQRRT